MLLTVTYSVNGKPIEANDLKNLQITRKDYIDYVEALKKVPIISTMYKSNKNVL